MEKNIFAFTEKDMVDHKIDALPGSLHEAAVNLAESKLMKEILGEHTHGHLVANKIAEWDAYRMHVSEFELERYLPIM